jgi:hypothetical protein
MTGMQLRRLRDKGGTKMQRRFFNWVALVGIGLAGVVAVSAATALAGRSAGSPFELVAIDRYEAECPDCFPSGGHVGTFTSGAPFCESGTIDDLGSRRQNETDRRYTCSDGSGSLTLVERNFGGGGNSGGLEWMIVEGSGGYTDLRGKGSYSYEVLSEYPPAVVYRTTLQGFVTAKDAVAPTLAFTSASVTKLRRPAGAYSIKVALSLRDDVEGNTVAYRLRVTQTRAHRVIVLASEEGTTASGSVSTTLRIVPGKRVRSVQLWLSGSDPAGNEVSIVRSLRLPRS